MPRRRVSKNVLEEQEQKRKRRDEQRSPDLPFDLVGEVAQRGWDDLPGERLRREATLGVQRLGGNRAARRQVGAFANLPMQNATRSLQLKKAPGAQESVGGDPMTMTFVDAPPGMKESTLAPGEQGFSRGILAQLPAAAQAAYGNYSDAHVSPVEPDFSHLDKQIATRAENVTEAKDNAEGKHSLFEPTPGIKKTWEERAESAQSHLDVLTSQKAEEAGKVASYNGWTTRANLTFVSLSRLEGLQNMLGVKDPAEMTTKLVEGLKEAEPIALRAQATGGGSLDVPEMDQQVQSQADKATRAASGMSAAWYGFKSILVKKNAKEIEAAGDEDRKRLEEINDVIEGWSKIGKTVDVSLTVLSGGSKALAGGKTIDIATGGLSGDGGLGDLKGAGSAVASEVGIPTDVSGLAKGVAQTVFHEEIVKLEKNLSNLREQVDSHNRVAAELGASGLLKTFENAVGAYKDELNELDKRLGARQLAYLKLGEQLDAAAKGDKTAQAEGTAPEKGSERFATIMLMTSAVREVLSMGRSARDAIDSPSALRSWLIGLEWDRKRRVTGFHPLAGVHDSEAAPLISMYEQVQYFYGNVQTLDEVLGPVDAQANALMTKLNAGKSGSGAY